MRYAEDSLPPLRVRAQSQVFAQGHGWGAGRGRDMLGSRLGKWVLDSELGRGGMGQVFLAHADPPDVPDGKQQRAALKVLTPELARDGGFLQRFRREIDVLRQLDHPNI